MTQKPLPDSLSSALKTAGEAGGTKTPLSDRLISGIEKLPSSERERAMLQMLINSLDNLPIKSRLTATHAIFSILEIRARVELILTLCAPDSFAIDPGMKLHLLDHGRKCNTIASKFKTSLDEYIIESIRLAAIAAKDKE